MTKKTSIWLLIAVVYLVIFTMEKPGGDGPEGATRIAEAGDAAAARVTANEAVTAPASIAAPAPPPSYPWNRPDKPEAGDEGIPSLAFGRYEPSVAGDGSAPVRSNPKRAQLSYAGIPVSSNMRPGDFSGGSFDPRLRIY